MVLKLLVTKKSSCMCREGKKCIGDESLKMNYSGYSSLALSDSAFLVWQYSNRMLISV
ncbi:hypothetical protein APHNP_0138 [Anaplasma phagocytophilum str. ApNP]|uniref:Uncharacterized protein n=1 Tax=Anaplasma phagocytophilum str. ApNP TaxID=1359153 RepID=A0A0F3NHV5_ANAPH|nr:hypothetical protein APHNP_0138 [Anaplasma phagocytophilum str. ApNP]